MSEPTKISADGLALVKKHEGLRLRAYLCPARVWTIGYGHTKTVRPGQVITEAEADALLRSDVEWAENAVSRLVTVPLRQTQFDALVSLVFNIGERAFRESTLLRRLNERNYLAAQGQFGRWNRGGGRVLPGLVRRRQDEAKLFAS